MLLYPNHIKVSYLYMILGFKQFDKLNKKTLIYFNIRIISEFYLIVYEYSELGKPDSSEMSVT